MRIVDDIMDLFARRGSAAYYGEAVSQTEHALQAAELASREGAPDHLVVAALLHDVGHLLDGQEEDLADRGLDGRHEEVGYTWLAAHSAPTSPSPSDCTLPPSADLCAVDPAYLAGLSSASRLSLSLQGGPMDAEECETLSVILCTTMQSGCGNGTTRQKFPG